MTYTDRKRPIGYWIQVVDNLIEERFEHVLADHHLARRHWQVLNVVDQGADSLTAVDDALRPFLDDSTPSTAVYLDTLVDRGWIANVGDIVALTEEGKRYLEKLREEVSRERDGVAAGIDPVEYTTVVNVLKHLAEDLGWQDDSTT